jgi:5-methyltetrahydrofolate--homocysteine methyltransferase
MPFTPFGAGTMAAYLGCTPLSTPRTVWFFPPKKDIPIEELHFEYDERNPYWRRVLNLYEAALERWGGRVVLGMVDIGGILDVLASFRGSENLLMDLYDSPEEVKRCVDELKELWFVYFDKINAMISPYVHGYSHWYGVFSEKPSYILQSDFSYMISPQMFDEFVAPELAWSAARLSNALYHMDGIGEIPHLSSLLAIKDIRGIQWQPGAGTPLEMDWTELLDRILDSGVKLLSCNRNEDGSVKEFCRDRAGQLYYRNVFFTHEEWDKAKAFGALYGIDVKL